MSKLPDGWCLVKLDDVGQWGSGGTPTRTNLSYYSAGTIPWLVIGDLNDGYVRRATTNINEEGLNNSSAKLLPVGTVLVAMYGSIGKLGIAAIECATNQAIAFCKPNLHIISVRYLFYTLFWAKPTLLSLGQGGAQQNISQGVLRDFQIPLAPQAEQTRIVNQLDKLLARIHACNDRLDTIPALLKRFRQAVLESALYGALLDDRKSSDDGEAEVSIASIAAVGTGSTPLRSNARFFASSGTPWITSAATSNQLITQANEFVTQEAIEAHRLKLYPKGTLLVAMYGEGKTRGQVAELGIEATINQACAAVVVDETKALVAYVKLAFQVNYLAMRELAEGGNQPNLNLSKVKKFRIPLPSLEQQERIVREANSFLQVAARIEARYVAARSQSLRLTPLLLAKTFRGELVLQDPNDEPASILLERITAERAQAAAQPRPRKPTARRKPVSTRKENATMTKSRQDDDVQGQPYLARHLRQIGGVAPAETLFNAAELPVADFYKQLAWEVAQGHLRDGKTVLELGDAA